MVAANEELQKMRWKKEIAEIRASTDANFVEIRKMLKIMYYENIFVIVVLLVSAVALWWK